MSRDVFISYKTEDKEAAERLCAALEREDISCWMAPRDIPPGQEWAASIVDGLQRSKSFVLLLSSHSVAAKQISREAELADKQNIPIITFRLEDVQPPRELLYFLGNIQWLEGFGGQFDSAAAQLANVIRSSANYPAPETHFPKASRTANIPVSAPPPPPPPAKLDPPPAKPAKPYLLPIAGGLVVLAAIGAWFALRPSSDHSNGGNSGTPDKVQVDPMQQAKAVADRFLKERDGGNYDAAWNEYSLSFHDRNKRDAWQNAQQKKAQETGAVKDEKFDYCKSSEQDVYICEYTLKYNNGSISRNDLWVIKDDKGGWAIDKGTIKAISP
jgi:hypothetical protein